MNFPDIVPRYGDLYNPPLQHSCLGGCGAYVAPDPDGAIPALCPACQAQADAAPPVKLYHDGRAYAAPPTAPESAWDRFVRLGDKAVDANGVQVRCCAVDYTCFAVSSQSHPDRWYTVTLGGLVRCTCQAWTAAGGCGHCSAVYRWLLAQAYAARPLPAIAVPRNPAYAYGRGWWVLYSAPREPGYQYVADDAAPAPAPRPRVPYAVAMAELFARRAAEGRAA